MSDDRQNVSPFLISDFGFRVLGFGCLVSSFGFQVFGFRVSGFELWVGSAADDRQNVSPFLISGVAFRSCQEQLTNNRQRSYPARPLCTM